MYKGENYDFYHNFYQVIVNHWPGKNSIRWEEQN